MTHVNLNAAHSPILDQALEMIELMGWSAFSLVELSSKSQIPLSEIYALFPDKESVIQALMTRVDQQVLDSLKTQDFQEPRRERLFEVFMNRFEQMAPYKSVIRSFREGALLDPLGSLKSAPKAMHSLQWMIEAAGYKLSGPMGVIKLNGFAIMFLGVVSDWLEDDSPDLNKTMSSLDQMISRIEPYLV